MMRMTKTRTRKTATSTPTTEKHYTLKGEAWTRYLKDTDQEPKPHPGAQRIYQISVDGLAVMLMFPFWWFLLSEIEEVDMSDPDMRTADAVTAVRKVKDESHSIQDHVLVLEQAVYSLDYKTGHPPEVLELQRAVHELHLVEQKILQIRVRMARQMR